MIVLNYLMIVIAIFGAIKAFTTGQTNLGLVWIIVIMSEIQIIALKSNN